jgi:hypothetical protein
MFASFAVYTVYRVNKEFSVLCKRHLFYRVAIGLLFSERNEIIPAGLLEHTYYIYLYQHAVSVCASTWQQVLAAKNVIGICFPPATMCPFWEPGRRELYSIHPRIVHFSLSFCLLFHKLHMPAFKSAVADLSKTVRSLTLDLSAADYNGFEAFNYVRKAFPRVTSLEISGFDTFNGKGLLDENWGCRDTLRRLRFVRCFLQLPDELSSFVTWMKKVTELELESCHIFKPRGEDRCKWTTLYIDKGREFEVLDLHVVSYWPTRGTLVPITVVEKS